MRCAVSFSPFFSSLVCVATCSLLAPVDPYQVTVSCLSSAGYLGLPRPGIGAPVPRARASFSRTPWRWGRIMCERRAAVHAGCELVHSLEGEFGQCI
jgi:hypothetical protein